MAPPSPDRRPLGGGILIAIGAIVGAFTGAALRQPSIGLLIGTATGIALATGLALRRR